MLNAKAYLKSVGEKNFPLIIFVITLNALPHISSEVTIKSSNISSHTTITKPLCNCVVFRMDDIQDYWIEPGQLTPMNLFMSKNQNLSLGVIMHVIGNDSKIVDKIREGSHKGLFELALHGWDHVDYTNMSENKPLKVRR